MVVPRAIKKGKSPQQILSVGRAFYIPTPWFTCVTKEKVRRANTLPTRWSEQTYHTIVKTNYMIE